jgi:subtilisin family serine protease
VVFLRNKETPAHQQALQHLTPACLKRRALARKGIDPTDYPVSESFIQRLQVFGVEVVAQSRWLNAVYVKTTPEQVYRIGLWAEVQHIRRITQKLKPLAGTVEEVPSSGDDPYAQCRQLGLDVLHNQGLQGAGIPIAVFDNGFRAIDTNKRFQHVFSRNQVKYTYDYVNRETDVYNTGGHGNRVLAILAALHPEKAFKGSAPDADYYLLHTESDRSETQAEEFYWAEAAEWAEAQGVRIFQTSLGYSRFDGGIGDYTYANMDGNTTIITRAADLAASKGVLVINSAGNEGNDPWKYITAPADGDSVLAVGAVDSRKTLADFSSLGPTADGRVKPNVVAWGSRTSTINERGEVIVGSGTSFSSPLVTGLAACLWQAHPTASAWDVHRAIEQSGDRALKPDNRYGYGLPNASKASAWLHHKTQAQRFRVFPNPAPGGQFSVLVSTQPIQETVRLSLLDLMGREIWHQITVLQKTEGTGPQLISYKPTLPVGQYIIRIQSTDLNKLVLYQDKMVVLH